MPYHLFMTNHSASQPQPATGESYDTQPGPSNAAKPPYRVWGDAGENRWMAVAAACVGAFCAVVAAVDLAGLLPAEEPDAVGLSFLFSAGWQLTIGAGVVLCTAVHCVVSTQQRKEMATGRLVGLVKWGYGPAPTSTSPELRTSTVL